MARKHDVDVALNGGLTSKERQLILEKELGRAIAPFNGVIEDKGIYGYAEVMFAFGLSREMARQLLQRVASSPNSRGKFRISQKEYFVFGLDLRLYFESVCSPAEAMPDKNTKAEETKNANGAKYGGQPRGGGQSTS